MVVLWFHLSSQPAVEGKTHSHHII